MTGPSPKAGLGNLATMSGAAEVPSSIGQIWNQATRSRAPPRARNTVMATGRTAAKG
jgi:hypothetical protein